jgi:transposase
MSIEAACSVSGISRATYYRWLEKSGPDGEWTEEVEAAKDFAEAVQLQRLKENAEAKQDWRGNAWILERRYPDRWGAKREVEVNVNDSSKKADDIVISMLEQISKPYQEANDDTEENDD